MGCVDSDLHDVPITISRSYKNTHKNKNQKRVKSLRYNYKTRICSILVLPNSILASIFSRLPITAIRNCKFVCREWYKLLSDPYFGSTYLENRVSVLLTLDYVVSYLIEVKYVNGYTKYPNKPLCIRNKIKLPKRPKSDSKVIGSCNGLVCLLHNHVLYISNPILGECVKIWPPRRNKYGSYYDFVYGFGCSAASGQFKILRIAKGVYFPKPLKPKAEVYTIGVDRSWRDVGEASFPVPKKICGVTLNGALHWIGESYDKIEVRLFSFDIAKENFRALPSPANLDLGFMIDVGVLGNFLCLFDNNWYKNIDIWWMKKYGVGDSWTRDRIFVNWVDSDFPSPITMLRGGEILMASCFGELFSYDPEKDSWTQVKVSNMGDFYCCEAIVYVPSFSSLKRVTNTPQGIEEHVQEERHTNNITHLGRGKRVKTQSTMLKEFVLTV